MFSKRGQITIIVGLGIVVLIVVSLALFITTEVSLSKFSNPELTEYTEESIRLQLQSRLKANLQIASMQGAYIYPMNPSLILGGYEIPILSTIINVEDVENQFKQSSENFLEEISNLQNGKFEMNNSKVEVKIESGIIKVNYSYSLESKDVYNKIDSTFIISSQLFDMITLSNDLILQNMISDYDKTKLPVFMMLNNVLIETIDYQGAVIYYLKKSDENFLVFAMEK